jgi:probable rRNA maturation factor
VIEINNLTTNPVDEEFLKKVAKKVLKEESAVRQPAERRKNKDLSIALIGQGRIRELNKRYRRKNRVTDVLAFPDKEMGLGEVVICLGEVKKNAKKYKSTFEKELAACLIHGILHLLGYDHEKSKGEAKRMEEKQNYYLKKL